MTSFMNENVAVINNFVQMSHLCIVIILLIVAHVVNFIESVLPELLIIVVTLLFLEA